MRHLGRPLPVGTGHDWTLKYVEMVRNRSRSRQRVGNNDRLGNDNSVRRRDASSNRERSSPPPQRSRRPAYLTIKNVDLGVLGLWRPMVQSGAERTWAQQGGLLGNQGYMWNQQTRKLSRVIDKFAMHASVKKYATKLHGHLQQPAGGAALPHPDDVRVHSRRVAEAIALVSCEPGTVLTLCVCCSLRGTVNTLAGGVAATATR